MPDVHPAKCGAYPNQLKRRLAGGEPVLSLRVLQSRSVDIVKVARASGHHALFIDLQHSTMALDTCAQICSAALDAGLTPTVRVPPASLSMAARVLEGGAQALVLPGIETLDDAEAAVRALRYPPLGQRSITGALPQTGLHKHAAQELIAAVEPETMLLIQIESRTAVKNAAAIATVAGIDALVTGTNDLCAELGIFGQHDHASIRRIHEDLAKCCRSAGIHLIAGGISNPRILAQCLELGAAPLFLTGSDTDLLTEGARRAAEAFSKVSATMPAGGAAR